MSLERELRKYQEDDAQFFGANPKSLVLYEPRMGKTPTTTSVINRDPQCRNIVIVAPNNARLVWEDHIRDWLVRDEVDFRFVQGDAQDRRLAWLEPSKAPISVKVLNQSVLLRDVKAFGDTLLRKKFDTFIFDEYHKWLLHKTKTWETLRPFTKLAHRVHGLSGTPLERGPYEFWPILYLLDHARFRSRIAFEEEFCIWNEGYFGNREYCGLKDARTWFRFLSQYARVRFRAQENMPEITRSKYHWEMTPGQERVYRSLDKDSFTFTDNGEVLVAANTVEKNMRLRQLLACPAILDPTLGVGGCMEQIVEELRDQEDPRARHVVIFTFFREALPHFKVALEKGLPGVPIELIHGGLEVDDLRQRIARYKGSRGIVLCTTSYAQAFDLSGASACYHVGWSYSANDNKQAEDRIIPQTSTGDVNSYYCIAKGTVEEEIAERVVSKHAYTHQALRQSPTEEGEAAT